MRDNVVRLGNVAEDNEGDAIDLDELNRMLPELLELAEKKAAAADAFAAAVDAAAHRSRASKSAIRKTVTALHKGQAKAALEDATEVADLIEAVMSRT